MKKLLLGLLGGAALGMLFAPAKGKDLRKKLSESDDKLKDFGGEVLSAGKEISSEIQKFLESDEAKDFFAKGKENISELLEKGKSEFSTLSEKGQEELKSAVKKVKKLGTDLQENISGEVCTDEKECSKPSNPSEKTEDILADLKNFFRK